MSPAEFIQFGEKVANLHGCCLVDTPGSGGDDDQIVPLDDSGRLSAQLVKDATLKVYPGAPHGLASTTAYKDTLNADLLAFLHG